MQAAIPRFQRRIDDLERFDPTAIRSRSDPSIDALEVAIDEALTEAFGHETRDYHRYSAASNLDTAGVFIGEETPWHEVLDGLVKGKQRAITLLRQAIRSFEEKLAELGEVKQPQPSATAESSEDVFIVHGHDGFAKSEVARLIERAGLNAVILHEQPNAGRTIMEKFEAHGGSAGFAVVLLVDIVERPYQSRQFTFF